ncbi:MAG: adenosylcobalamin-dependent ribonucleoside-diphosphate reductase [Bacteroidia bacterium]
MQPLENKVYSYEEVYEKCMLYFNGDDLAVSTWINKYALKNTDGHFLETTPDDMHRRMAKEFYRKEKEYENKREKADKELLSNYGKTRKELNEETIFNYFKNFKYVIPQGSVMASLGNNYTFASLSNCIVLPEIFDSYGGIFYTDQQMAQLFKRRCGVGIDISSLRPSGAHVLNAAGTSSGAVSFMERFSNTTREVSQDGRRGALMITMDVAHPDIEQFVSIKQDLTKITGANISVRISDEFMNAVINNSDYELKFPIDSSNPIVRKKINARTLWETIITCAYNTAEPGIIFWDKQHSYSTSSVYPGFKNVSTNPCSEIAMQGGDSCRLIALNLFSFIHEPFTTNATFDYTKFYQITYEAQRLMDNLVDLELEHIERILSKIKNDPEPDYIKSVEESTWKLFYDSGKKGRRTGLGFTALADTLAALNLKFDSDEALLIIDKIMRTKCEAEFDSSIDMAIERGKFKAFNKDIENTSAFVTMLNTEFPNVYRRMMLHGRRNISISTVAPTGSISILSQTSSGIEPVFQTHYKRRKKVNPSDKNSHVDYIDKSGDSWEEFDVYHPKLKQWMEATGSNDIANNPYKGATATEIDWLKRIEIQALIQKYVTHSISSTINLASTIDKEKVKHIYFEAWQKGLKGITVYRDGSRSGVLISAEKEELPNTTVFVEKRPEKIDATVVRFMNIEEKWIAVIGIVNDKPYEIFTGKSNDIQIPEWVEKGWIVKTKNENNEKEYNFHFIDNKGKTAIIKGLSGTFNKEYWNYAKLISGVLRYGMPIHKVVDLVHNLNLYDASINTWKYGVERALKKFIPSGTTPTDKTCPNCKSPNGLIYEEGCLKCRNCTYSKCS